MSTSNATESLLDDLTGQVGRAVSAAAESPERLSGFQLGVRHGPDVVVAARGIDDVRAAVRVATDRQQPLTVQNTGHGVRTPAAGGILVITSDLDGVAVDPDARTARVGAGATWERVNAAADRFDLRGPSGSYAGVGAIGYTFGGGLGLTGRADGWATDHVRAYEVVDGAGERHEVTADADPDRFARLRGTGPVPGEVVTAMTIGLLPAGPLTGGHLLYDLGPTAEPGDATPLHAFRAWTSELPDSVTAGMEVVAWPEADFLPPFLRGRRAARIAVVVLGGVGETDRLLAPLRAAAPAAQDTIGPLRSVDAGRVYDEPTYPHGYASENALLDDLVPAGLDAVATLEGPLAIVGVRHLGGALARPPAVPDTVAGRDATHLVSVLGLLMDPEAAIADPAAALAEIDVSRVLKPFTSARTGTNRNFAFGPRPT